MKLSRTSKAAIALLYMVVIFIGSAIPGDHLGDSKLFEMDKLLHAIEYMILSLLLCWIFFRNPHELDWYAIRLVVTIGGLYAITDEVHQLFVPKRTFSLMDLLADFLGLAAGILIFHLYMTKIHPKFRNAI